MIGQKFGHYEVTGELGAGGMGVVYKARDPRLDRDVALKFLGESFAGDSERLARFEREARLLASLNHPNIAAIHGLEEDGGRRALVLEYVAGEDLSEVIQRGPMSLDDTLETSRQIADALDAAHEQGVIHRDLKPGNIKITRDGTVKVLDFGLAKALEAGPDGQPDPSITQSPTAMGTAAGVILGTAAYMSPEQARGKLVDKRADIWAFGCVLFEMLTARTAFPGDTVSDTIAAILRADPPWESLPEETPSAIQAIAQRCLEKDPKRRLRDVGEARLIIEAIQRGESASAILVGNSSSVIETAPGAMSTAAGRSTSRAGVRNNVHWVFTSLFMLACVALAVLYISEINKREPARVVRALITPEEGKAFNNSWFGAHAFHCISPDGSKIAFISDDYVWSRSFDQINATKLEGTKSGNFPFWSHDGRYIGFFADGKLKTIPAEGGPVTVVCDAIDGRGGTWNQDDVIVFTPRLRTGLYRVPASGGTPEPVTTVTRPTHSTHRWPRFMPDGEHILYMAANHTNPKGAQTAIYVTRLSGGEGRLLVPADSHPVYASGYLLYTRDRNLMARPFDEAAATLEGEPVRVAENCAHHGGSWVGVFDARGDILTYQGDAPLIGSMLTWLAEDGSLQGTIGERDLYWDASISRDGKRAAFARGNPEPSVFVYDVEHETEARLTTDGSFSRAPVWSPDGTRIAYASIRDNGRLNVYVVPSDRSAAPEPLIVDDVDMIPTSWSTDGKHLLVDHGDPGETEIWVITMEGEPEARPVVQTRPWVYSGYFSPDGKWLAYTSREEGADDVFIIPFPGPGAKTKVTRGGGTMLDWGTSQRLYISGNDQQAMVTTIQETDGGIRFTAPRQILSFRGDDSFFVQSGTGFAASPDGRFLVMMAGEDRGEITTITLVLGWTSEIGAR